VALEVLVPCHACAVCLAGRYGACTRRAATHGYTPVDVAPSLWGGLAEYTYVAPGSILHKVPHHLPAEVAVMYNPLGAGVRWTLHLGQVRRGSTVLVLGAGQRGLMCVVAAKAAGAGTVIVTGLATDAHKLDLARSLGADHTIVVDGPDAVDTVDTVMDLTGGLGVDVVLELTPMAAAPVGDALRSARHGGRIVLAGLKGGKAVPVDTDVMINRALTVVGAYGVDAPAYAEAIDILASGAFPLETLHTHSVGLDQVEYAIELLAGSVDTERAVHVSVHPAL
jgi:threonine dehydrogenase-like Zn-dependent dehydrogenase